jgi:hypothetical protein
MKNSGKQKVIITANTTHPAVEISSRSSGRAVERQLGQR